MTRIGLIPLDDRPVSTADPVLLAQLAGAEVLIPPPKLLGHRDQPGNTEALGRWWLENANAADGWVIALDMLLYGGLVASRTITEPLANILQRLETIQAVRKLALDIPIYAFQAIRRLAVTVSSSADLSIWRETHSGGCSLYEERERNHLVNIQVLDQVANGGLNVLNFLQEDAHTDGPQLREQKILQEKIQNYGLSKKVVITTGCDEGAIVLIARLLAPLNPKGSVSTPLNPPKVGGDNADSKRVIAVDVYYSSELGSKRIPLYEDRPLHKVVEGQFRAMDCNLNLTSPQFGGIRGGLSLLIWCPDRPCEDRMLGSITEVLPDSEVEKFISKVKQQLSTGKKVIIADVADANGADPKLMTALQQTGLLDQLSGFSAWNTAANTIGTALAQAVLPLSSKEFYHRRLIDDWCYQTIVRPKLITMLSERRADIWKLSPEEVVIAEKYLNELMANHQQYSYRLPWQRVFEIELK